MKKLCLVASVILAPIIFTIGSGLALGLVFGIFWILNQFPSSHMIGIIFASIIALVACIGIGCTLYNHCTEYWGRRK